MRKKISCLNAMTIWGIVFAILSIILPFTSFRSIAFSIMLTNSIIGFIMAFANTEVISLYCVNSKDPTRLYLGNIILHVVIPIVLLPIIYIRGYKINIKFMLAWFIMFLIGLAYAILMISNITTNYGLTTTYLIIYGILWVVLTTVILYFINK